MTPDQEKNMRISVGDYTTPQLVDLTLKLQSTIDTHVAEQRSRQTAVDQMARQNEALISENERLEALAEGAAQVDEEEVEFLRQQVNLLNIRVVDLQALNEGLQKKLIS